MIKSTTDSIIDLMEQEVDFYSKHENPIWSEDMNTGFKAGLGYALQMIKKSKTILDNGE